MSSSKQTDAGRKNRLTARQKDIIEILTRFTASRPVTVGMISEMLGVSSRTILREIPHVERWLTQNDFHFIRKPGVGLILDENVDNQKLILELLEVEAVQKDYSKEERRRRILGELLCAREPLKSYYFTSKFHISEGTFSTDLDEAAKWLEQYHIRIIRRPGLGILLEGNESSYRQAIANIVYESMDESQLVQLLCGGQTEHSRIGPVHNRVFDLIDREMTAKVERVLIATEKKLRIRYTDSAYVGLIVHLSLAIKRLQNHETIEIDREKLQKAMMLPEFSVAEEIGDQLREIFGIKIPKSEIGFITMHLSSAQIWSDQSRVGGNIEAINLRQLARAMTQRVEDDLGIVLHDDEVLIEDLANHIAPAIRRLSMGIRIENSQLESIKEEYPEVVQATRAACEVLKQEIGTDEIPEAEMGYLAMHFGAAMEKQLEKMQRISAVVVCPTGVGTSRILEANLKKAFSCIQVKGEIPQIAGMNLAENLMAYIERKLFTLNTGHAITAYLGTLKGLHTIDEAIADEKIYDIVHSAMKESGDGLIRKHGFDQETHYHYIDKIIGRFKNPYLKDDVTRVGREPLRKLSATDRLTKPMMTAYGYGLPVDHLILGMGAALHYNNPDDAQSVELQKKLQEKGLVDAIREVTGITDGDLIARIVGAYDSVASRL